MENSNEQFVDFKHCSSRGKYLAFRQKLFKEFSPQSKCNISNTQYVKHPPTEKSSRTSNLGRTRFFLKSFPKAETRWGDSLDSKFKTVKSSYNTQKVLHALSRFNSDSCTKAAICGITGPKRRLHACKHKEISKKISTIRPQQKGHEVSNAALWPDHEPTVLYDTTRPTDPMGYKTEYQSNKLLGRFPYYPRLPNDVTHAQRYGNGEDDETRLDNQLEKIGPDTSTEISVCGNAIQHKKLFGRTHGETYKDHGRTISTLHEEHNHNTSSAAHIGDTNFPWGVNTAGTSEAQAFPIRYETFEDASISKTMQKKNTSHTRNAKGTGVVETQVKHVKKGANKTQASNYNAHHGCIDSRMGSRVQRLDCSGVLESDRSRETHQYTRDEGNLSCHDSLHGDTGVQAHHDHDRQHNSHVLHQETRRYSISRVNDMDREDMGISSSAQYRNQHQPHIVRSECASGQAEQSEQTTSVGVEPEPRGIPQHMHTIPVYSGNRPICNEVEQPSASVCEPVSRRESTTRKCHDDKLEHVQTHISVSPIKVIREGNREITHVQRRSDCDCTLLSNNHIPPSSSKHVKTKSHKAASKSRSVSARHRGTSATSKTKYADVTRLDYIRSTIRKQGFSSEVAKRAAGSQRASSIHRYDYIWNVFRNWHKTNYNTNPFEATVQQLAEYLVQLKNNNKKLATILTHKSAVCGTLQLTSNKNHSEHPIIKRLIQNFKSNITVEKSKIPDWNFNIVLAALRRHPFEPMNTVDIKFVTMKCLFLTAWASAARVSEIQALSRKEGHFLMDTKRRFVDLIPDSSFVAKNQRAGEPQRKFRIHAIHRYIHDDELEELLCPVRALRIYKTRTTNRVSKYNRLFVCLKKKADMAIHSISYWIRRTIKVAYENTNGESLGAVHKVSAHEVRAVATSLAANKHIPIKDIMRQAYWKSESTFISYYLRDLEKYNRDVKGISTIAAGFSLQI